jgi:hypothetical protein
MFSQKIFRQLGLWLVFGVVLLSCGEDSETGTLEIRMQNLDAVESNDLTMVVRVNAVEKRRLPNVPSVVFIDEVHKGVANIGIDFKNGDDVKFSGPHEIAIERNQIAILEVDLREIFGTPDVPVLVARWRFDRVRLEITKNLDIAPVDSDGKILKISGGETIAHAGSVVVEDLDGNPINKLIISIKAILRSGLVEFNEEDMVYKGDADGRFIIYQDEIKDENIIFQGIYLTDPPGNLRVAINPENQMLLEFRQQLLSKATGKGIYENHILEAKDEIKLVGDLLQLKEEADIFQLP